MNWFDWLKPKLIALVLLGSAFNACTPEHVAGGAGAGNPPLAKVSVSVKANSTAPIAKTTATVLRNPDGTLSILDSANHVITLTAIEAQIKGIDVTLPDSVTCKEILNLPCQNEEATLPGPYTVELISGKSTAALDHFQLPSGTYKKMGIEFVRPENDSDSSAQWDSSMQNMVIRGRMGLPSYPGKLFELKLNLRNGLDFLDSTGVQVRLDTLNAIQLLLKTDLWFRDADLAKCLDGSTAGIDSSGIVQLNGDQACQGAGLRIRKSIEASGQIDEEYQSQQ